MKLKKILVFAHRNTRAEKIGEENQRALDLKFEGVIKLDQIEKFLSKAWQETLSTMFHPDGLPKFPGAKIDVPSQYENVKAVIKHDVPSAKPMTFTGSKVKSIHLVPIEGHMVQTEFKVAVHPSTEQDGLLGEFLKGEASVSLSGGTEAEPEEDDGQGELPVGEGEAETEEEEETETE